VATAVETLVALLAVVVVPIWTTKFRSKTTP